MISSNVRSPLEQFIGLELFRPHRLGTFSICFYAVSAILALVIISSSGKHAYSLKHAAELNGFGTKATHLGESFLEGLTFGGYDGASKREADYAHTVAAADEAAKVTFIAALLLAVLTGLFLWHVHVIGPFASHDGPQLVVRHYCYTSLILFCVGVGATALGLIAFKEVPVLGTVVFKFEAKGIASTIMKLFSSGNAVLGFLIFLFSIAVPLAKVGLMLYATYTSGESHETALKIIKAVGKWSMADVFVVAVLLAMFAIGGDETTDAFTGPGIYFFAAYCMLSMWASVLLARTHGHASEVSEPRCLPPRDAVKSKQSSDTGASAVDSGPPDLQQARVLVADGLRTIQQAKSSLQQKMASPSVILWLIGCACLLVTFKLAFSVWEWGILVSDEVIEGRVLQARKMVMMQGLGAASLATALWLMQCRRLTACILVVAVVAACMGWINAGRGSLSKAQDAGALGALLLLALGMYPPLKWIRGWLINSAAPPAFQGDRDRPAQRLSSSVGISHAGLTSTAPEVRRSQTFQYRTWKSALSGKTVEAAFLTYADGVVHVVKRDGTKGRLPISKLSASDRTYVERCIQTGEDDFFESST